MLPSILDKDYTITAEVTIPEGGAEGMIVTLGGRFGGYGLYLLKGKPVFVYNLLDLKRYRWEGGLLGDDLFGRALKPGKHTLVFDFKYDGPGPGKGGTGVFTVDGKELARKTIPHTIPLLMSIDETFDVGIDTRTAVDDSYELPFRFTGHDQQADLQARAIADDGGGTAGRCRSNQESHRLTAHPHPLRKGGGSKGPPASHSQHWDADGDKPAAGSCSNRAAKSVHSVHRRETPQAQGRAFQ